MQEYRLTAWPDLDAPFQRMAYRRMLNDMSQRHVSLARLAAVSRLPREEVDRFVQMLEARGQVERRDGGRFRGAFAWLRRGA